MKRLFQSLASLLLAAFAGLAIAAPQFEITLKPDITNPASPQMGNRLHFISTIRNVGDMAAHGVVAWISLVEIDPGHEQPMDLEDWSAHKAITRVTLARGAKITVNWPMRLIQAGDYRVVISALERGAPHIATSPFVDFHVRQKPVVESWRILPVAFGVPLALSAVLAWSLRRRRSAKKPGGLFVAGRSTSSTGTGT